MDCFNYIIFVGYIVFCEEYEYFFVIECFVFVEVIFWVVGNGDWLENGDYIYGCK